MAKAKKTQDIVDEVSEVTTESPVKEEVVVIEDTVLKTIHREVVLGVTLDEGGRFVVQTRSGQVYTLPPEEYEYYLKHDPKRK